MWLVSTVVDDGIQHWVRLPRPHFLRVRGEVERERNMKRGAVEWRW